MRKVYHKKYNKTMKKGKFCKNLKGQAIMELIHIYEMTGREELIWATTKYKKIKKDTT